MEFSRHNKPICMEAKLAPACKSVFTDYRGARQSQARDQSPNRDTSAIAKVDRTDTLNAFGVSTRQGVCVSTRYGNAVGERSGDVTERVTERSTAL